MYSDIQEVCRSCRIVTAEVYRGAVGCNCSIDFKLNAKYLSMVERSTFSVRLHGHILTAWYKHVVEYSDLQVIHSQCFCGEYSSGHIQNAKQPSPTKAVE